jgi:hypothetical protein
MRAAIIAAVFLAFTGAADAEHWEHVQTHLGQLIDQIDIAGPMNTCQDVADVPSMYVSTDLSVNGMSLTYRWAWTCQRHVLYFCSTQNCYEPPNSVVAGGDQWTRINPPSQPTTTQVPTQGESGSNPGDSGTHRRGIGCLVCLVCGYH